MVEMKTSLKIVKHTGQSSQLVFPFVFIGIYYLKYTVGSCSAGVHAGCSLKSDTKHHWINALPFVPETSLVESVEVNEGFLSQTTVRTNAHIKEDVFHRIVKKMGWQVGIFYHPGIDTTASNDYVLDVYEQAHRIVVRPPSNDLNRTRHHVLAPAYGAILECDGSKAEEMGRVGLTTLLEMLDVGSEVIFDSLEEDKEEVEFRQESIDSTLNSAADRVKDSLTQPLFRGLSGFTPQDVGNCDLGLAFWDSFEQRLLVGNYGNVRILHLPSIHVTAGGSKQKYEQVNEAFHSRANEFDRPNVLGYDWSFRRRTARHLLHRTLVDALKFKAVRVDEKDDSDMIKIQYFSTEMTEFQAESGFPTDEQILTVFRRQGGSQPFDIRFNDKTSLTSISNSQPLVWSGHIKLEFLHPPISLNKTESGGFSDAVIVVSDSLFSFYLESEWKKLFNRNTREELNKAFDSWKSGDEPVSETFDTLLENLMTEAVQQGARMLSKNVNRQKSNFLDSERLMRNSLDGKPKTLLLLSINGTTEGLTEVM